MGMVFHTANRRQNQAIREKEDTDAEDVSGRPHPSGRQAAQGERFSVRRPAHE
jgi:hypothetical protein